jgi:hypothetical protein
MRLSSGYIIVGAYADKVRRTLFAQLKDLMKSGEMDAKEIARAAGELNRLLYEIFVNKLKLDKGDVVRVRIEYEVESGEVKWDYKTLEIEVFRREEQEKIDSVLKEALENIEKIKEVVRSDYIVNSLGKTELGDEVYEVILNDERVGMIIATPIDGEAIVRGALVKPTPLIIDKTRIPYQGEGSVAQSLEDLLQRARHVSEEEARKVKEEIEGLL